MAKIQAQRKQQQKKKSFATEAELPQRENYIILLIGVAVIVFGYAVMASGDAVSPSAVTIAPIILVIGYCIIIPFGIIYKKKKASPQG